MKRRILILCLALLLCAAAAGGLLLVPERTGITVSGQLCADALGLVLEESADHDLRILAVRNHSPADRAGLCPGDALLAVNDTSVHQQAQLEELLARLTPPCALSCQIVRYNRSMTLLIKLK